MAIKTYWQKLQDPRWQKKRLEVLSDNNFACENCGSEDSQLHVHHPAYIKGRDPWEYEADELQSLCDSCHRQSHFEIDLLTSVLNEIKLHSSSNMQLAGFLTAYNHDGPFNIPLIDAAFASGVGMFYHKTEEEVIESRGKDDELQYETISRWIKEMHRNG